jgi:chemotaxis protein methyltransferase CheR
VPAPLREAWTKATGDKATIADEARGLVRFRTLNLHGEWPMRRPFDVIFCRNVMIYFDHPTKERLVSRFVDALAPGGHLYIGHSERVTGATADRLEPVGATIYRKVR